MFIKYTAAKYLQALELLKDPELSEFRELGNIRKEHSEKYIPLVKALGTDSLQVRANGAWEQILSCRFTQPLEDYSIKPKKLKRWIVKFKGVEKLEDTLASWMYETKECAQEITRDFSSAKVMEIEIDMGSD